MTPFTVSVNKPLSVVAARQALYRHSKSPHSSSLTMLSGAISINTLHNSVATPRTTILYFRPSNHLTDISHAVNILCLSTHINTCTQHTHVSASFPATRSCNFQTCSFINIHHYVSSYWPSSRLQVATCFF